MEAIKSTHNQRQVISNVTLWEEDGIVNFYFEEDTVIDADLVIQMFDDFSEVNCMKNKSTLLNLEGISGATLEGLSLLNQKLENFSNHKAILVNDEKTEIIGRVMANSFSHNKPTKVFKSALKADAWMN
tara:strand:- start:740 stop:1126 length:387 start_codon:yes stop_codon:yes gene_type:complete